MIFALFVLFTALCISATAAYYSIVGLMAIFSGAALSIAIMGTVLEVGKLVTASWLYQYWPRIPKLIRSYLLISVIVLMLITSMGIFGYLSKAHLEQSAMTEESIAQIGVYNEKLTRAESKIIRWNEEIGRLNRGENFRVDNLVKTEQEALDVIYERIKQEKDQFKTIADEQIAVQDKKLIEYAERTKIDLALLDKRPDGKIDEETGKSEKEIEIDKVRKRDRGVSWVARDKIRKINEQLRKDFAEVDKKYASQINEINERIAGLRTQAQLKTEDVDAKVAQLEGFIDKEQGIADEARSKKLKFESQFRQLEVEVGPVKYIADMIYGDDAKSMLDSAVRGVIITLIFVFDPLAVLLVIAGNMTINWKRGRKENDDEFEQPIMEDRPLPGPTTPNSGTETRSDQVPDNIEEMPEIKERVIQPEVIQPESIPEPVPETPKEEDAGEIAPSGEGESVADEIVEDILEELDEFEEKEAEKAKAEGPVWRIDERDEHKLERHVEHILREPEIAEALDKVDEETRQTVYNQLKAAMHKRAKLAK